MSYQIYFEQARQATRVLNKISDRQVNEVLKDVALALVANSAEIIAANLEDLSRMPATDPKYDRLKLNEERLKAMAEEVMNVVALDSPLGELISEKQLVNGLNLKKIRVALGVVGVIYEARPNVTLDVFSLCFKTGNVAVLKGGSDAEASNTAVIRVIHEVLRKHEIDVNVAILLPAEREATAALLGALGYIDVLIPRGSQSLINYVRAHSRVPVIETGAGIVHAYFDVSGDLEKGKAIVLNAKTRRVSVCNALDCLLVHQDRLDELWPLVAPLLADSVELFADESSYQILQPFYPAALLHRAGPDDYGTEFLDYKMAVKVVVDLADALSHIADYSSKHSEVIIAEDEDTILGFLNAVDAAAVYANASTAFTDGGQFGLGAEIGISTQKLHARGPMGLTELTSYKWVIRGNGQTR